MGILVDALKPRAQVSTPIWSPSWGSTGVAQSAFERTARAYSSNEIVAAGLNLIASSAAEPHLIGRRYRRARPQARAYARALSLVGFPNNKRVIDTQLIRNGFYEEVEDNPLIDLLNNPNPYTSRGQFWSSLVLDRYLAGNAYALKARTKIGNQVGELWRLRPDQMKPVPGNMSQGEQFITGYEYSVGGMKTLIPADDVIHFKSRNPMSPYEGASELLPILPRVNIDAAMRNFLSTFFERGGAGVGASLNIKGGTMNQEAKDDIRNRFKRMFSGGQYDVLVTAAEDITYTPFNLNRGLRDALPKEIDAVNEARIAMVLGIPGAILGLLIGYETSSYANQRQAWQVLWDVTMTPLLSDFDDVLNLSFKLGKPGAEFGGVDEVYFDLSDIKALQEDEEALQERARKNVAARIWTMEEGRMKTGMAEPDAGDHFLLPDGSAVKVSELDSTAPAQDEPAALTAGAAVALLTAGRVGRPRVEDDAAAKAVYDEAMSLKARNPGLTWEQVAARVGVESRTLRKYRTVFDDDED